jgi:uncharacterized protein YjiS (DUF1127 family)
MTLNTETLQTGGATLGFAAQRLAEIGKGLWRAYWRRRAERATIATLQALGDNVLRDIGIERSEIEWAARNQSMARLRRFDTL